MEQGYYCYRSKQTNERFAEKEEDCAQDDHEKPKGNETNLILSLRSHRC